MLPLRPLAILLFLAAPAAAQVEVPDYEPGGVLASPIRPAPPSEFGRDPAPVQRPPPLRVPPRELNQGPVTGYGAGGMQPMPGAPLNPPYLGRPVITLGHH